MLNLQALSSSDLPWVLLGPHRPGRGAAGRDYDARHTVVSGTTPEVWVPELGSGEYGFPLLSGAGRLVIKDTAILAGVVVLLSDTARKLLARRREA